MSLLEELKGIVHYIENNILEQESLLLDYTTKLKETQEHVKSVLQGSTEKADVEMMQKLEDVQNEIDKSLKQIDEARSRLENVYSM